MSGLAQSITQHPIRTSLKWSLLTLLGLVLAYQIFLFSHVLLYRFINPSSTAFMRAQAAELDNKTIQYIWVDYENISASLKKAVIASEDSGFKQHSGVEWLAIRHAFMFNLKQWRKGKERMRGGSTISQQLAKNLFLSENRSYWRKAQELVITYMLEWTMPKKRILELYLNTAQFGETVFGAEAASQFYFKKSSKQLNNHEASRLAVLLPNPRYYGQHIKGAYVSGRASIIRQRMRQVSPP